MWWLIVKNDELHWGKLQLEGKKHPVSSQKQVLPTCQCIPEYDCTKNFRLGAIQILDFKPCPLPLHLNHALQLALSGIISKEALADLT